MPTGFLSLGPLEGRGLRSELSTGDRLSSSVGGCLQAWECTYSVGMTGHNSVSPAVTPKTGIKLYSH